MEPVSWIVIAVTVIAILLMIPRKTNATMILAISNIVIFAIIELGYYGAYNETLVELGLKSHLTVQEPWTLITSMFLHASFVHLIFNMLFLIAIGIPLESRLGKTRFMMIYILGGIVGSIVFVLVEWSATVNVILVGASGAISSLMGAMIMLYPRERIMFFLGPLLTDRFSVYIPILIWFVLQMMLFFFDDSPVAYAAHLGGFMAGAGIAWIIRPNNTSKRLRVHCESLKELCTTPALKEMYMYAESARDDETRKIWVQRILKDVRCPICGSELKKKGKGFECGNGHTI